MHVRRVAIPEIEALRELRRALACGGIPPLDKRTPSDCARIAAFYTVLDLVRLLEAFKSRFEGGERCRIVEVRRSHELRRFAIEFAIDSTTDVPEK